MKNNLIDKISSVHSQIETLEKELNGSFPISDNVDRTNKIEIGSKVVLLQELNVKLFTTIELFLEIGGTIEELPDGPKEYYLLIEELKKPASDTDTEEVKKIKDFINNYNKNGA